MDRDRKTVGLTIENQTRLEEIEGKGWFVEGQDIARFCLGYALRARVPAGETAGTETRWAAGNFDNTGEIRAILGAVYPDCETPVTLMEHLVNEGLKLVYDRLRADGVGPAELLD